MYSVRNLIIGYSITIAVVLMIVLNTFSNLLLQKKELAKILKARKALQTLQPAQLDLEELEAIKIHSDSTANALKKLQADSMAIEELATSNSENEKTYRQLNAGMQQAIQLKLKHGDIAPLVRNFKVISSGLEAESRKILNTAYSSTIDYTRRTVIFVSLIAAALVAVLLVSFILSYRDIVSRARYNKQLKEFNKQLEEQVQVKTAEIQKNEEQYRILVERLADGILITDTKGTILETNSSICRLYGYSKEELHGRNASDFILPGQLKSDPIRYDLLVEGQTQLRERKVITKNGDIIEVEANSKLLPDGRLLAVIRDISERKKNEEEKERVRYQLNERIKELTTLYNAGQILETDDKPDHLILQEIVNVLPAGWQYPEVAAARITLGDQQYTANGFRETLWCQKTEFTIADGRQGKMEVVYLEEKPQEYEGAFLSEERKLINLVTDMLCAFFARKAAAEQIRKEKDLSDSIINSLPGVFFLQDFEGNYIRWNKALEELSGHSSAEIKKMNALDFIAEADRPIIEKRIKELYNDGSTQSMTAYVMRHGQKVPYYFTGQKIQYEDKPCLIGTGIDITAQKEAEEKLKESYEEVRQLTKHIQNIREQERTHIAREIHDELGQQLTVLKMDVAWLQKKIDTDDKMVKEKMKGLLDLLDITVKSVRRISSELRPSLLDDLGLVAAMEWHLKEFEKRSGIHTQFTEPGTELPLTDAVRTGLFRIFQESLTNVARHSDAAQVRVDLVQKNGQLILSIEDNGKGFDKQKASEKKTLGILGMRERSAMMGGNYEINSIPGTGTTVIVTVPFK